MPALPFETQISTFLLDLERRGLIRTSVSLTDTDYIVTFTDGSQVSLGAESPDLSYTPADLQRLLEERIS